MTDEVLSKLIEFIENASPKLWQILIKQVYAENIAMIAWSIFLLVFVFICAVIAKHGYEESQEESYSSWEIAMWLSVIIGSIALLIAFGLLISVMLHYANPEFYAIRFIIQSLTGN